MIYLLFIAAFIIPVLLIFYVRLSDFKWFRKLKGGEWNQVWWNKYHQGGHTCWVNYHVEDSPYSKILKTEIYK